MQKEVFSEVRVGDECAFALNIRGEILCFGENIDNQLGEEQHKVPFR